MSPPPLHCAEGKKLCLWAIVLIVTVAIEIITWRSVAGLRQESRVQLDQMIFQTGMLSPLMNDYMRVLKEMTEIADQPTVIVEKQRQLLAIRRRMEPHLSLLRQTIDLLSDAHDRKDIRRSLSKTIEQTMVTLRSAQVGLSGPVNNAWIEGARDSLEKDLASFCTAIVHTIEEDLDVQQERSNLFATLIGVLFSVLLAGGLAMVWLIVVLRRKTGELNRLAMTDTLTGLINRRECVRRASLSSVHARQKKLFMTVAVIDLDHFKAINDTRGHPAGDAVLKSVALTIDACRRKSDIVARLGGEEFALVMFDINRSAASILCEKVKREIETSIIRFDGQVIPVTASIGVATGHGSNADFQALYARADKALYQAKEAGRNRTVVAECQDCLPDGSDPSLSASDADLRTTFGHFGGHRSITAAE